MAFLTKEFIRTKFEPRTADIPVPDLKQWFDGDDLVWRVRGLDGNELGRCNALAEKNRRSITEIAEGLTSGKSAELIGTVRQLVGLGDDIPMEVAQGIEYLICGSVNPECDLDLAVKLNLNFPVEFRQLVHRIIHLTGMGFAAAGKPPASGTDPISK